MLPVYCVLDVEYIRKVVKKRINSLAKWLDEASNSKITPNQITLAALFLHLLIFFAIVAELFILAAVMVVIFGLMDSLDGALARQQGRESKSGMLLDASTDRIKESIIFAALAYRFALDGEPRAVLLTIIALSGSFAVSYIKAKGETALRRSKLTTVEINRIFQAGLMRYEVRMAVLVVGLIFNRLLITAILVIAVLAWLTAIYRLVSITRKISQ